MLILGIKGTLLRELIGPNFHPQLILGFLDAMQPPKYQTSPTSSTALVIFFILFLLFLVFLFLFFFLSFLSLLYSVFFLNNIGIVFLLQHRL